MNVDPASPQHPRALLEAWGLRPKKKFGQNFLMDGGAAHRIARLCLEGAEPGTRVIEIGAGTGALTQALLDEGADVTAIEIDRQLVSILGNRPELARAHIVFGDAMAYDYGSFAARGRWRAAGNLPYNVATPLLMNLIDMENGPETIVAMIQKDVADRLAAKPSSPAYGSLSIAVQYEMRVERAFTLGPRSFYPQPKVDSTVVRLTRLPSPAVTPADVPLFRKVVRAAFAYRRKTLANSLALSLERDRHSIAAAIAASSLAPEIRGEQLALDDFARLADALASR